MSEETRPIRSRAAHMTRRQMLRGACVVAAVGLAGCGDGAAGDGVDDDGSGGPGGPDGPGGSGAQSGPGAQGGPGGHRGDGTNRPPEWQPIPDQVWMVGIPVLLDLASYCADPDGNPLSITLDRPLPPGLTLEGSVIRGVPTAEMAAAPLVVTADDGA